MTINREIWLSNAEQASIEGARTRELWEELNAERGWRFENVQVSVNDLVAVLSGTVPRLPDKLAAERLAKRVPGIQAVVNRIAVSLSADEARGDAELTRIASYALEWCSLIPPGRVHVIVERGRVSLHGDVDTEHERAAAEETVQRLVGVRDVVCQIVVAPAPITRDTRARVDRALHDDPMLHGAHIKVDAGPAHVILRGRVRSLAERQEAERVVREMAGDERVIDALKIKR
jgi:osmotically-inducible protein OsmY